MCDERFFGLEKKRYETAGINSELDIEYRLLLWQLVDELRDSEVEIDYLQVFEFSVDSVDGRKVQILEHRQECPDYKMVYQFGEVENFVQAKIYVIDDGDHCTMLFASEY